MVRATEEKTVDIDFDGIVTETVGDIAAFVPKVIAFALILIVGSFVAKWLRRIVATLLRKIRFDEHIDRAGIGAPLERAGFADSARFVAQILYYLAMLLVLKLALSAFGRNDISDALDGLVAFIPKLIVAIVIVVITGLVAKAVGNVLRPMLHDIEHGGTLATIATTAIWVIGGFAALAQIEFDPDIVDTLFTALIGSLRLILVIKFGVGGIWSARDSFWPAVYRKLGASQDRSQ